MTVSYKVVNRDPVPVSALDADIPPMLDYVVPRAMAKDRRQRYQTGMELALDVQDLRQGFIPRSSMTPAGAVDPTSGIKTGSYEPALTARMEAVKLGSTGAQARRGRGSTGWPMWQYVAALIMGAGVLGIGFAMFRRPGNPPTQPQSADPSGMKASVPAVSQPLVA